MYKFNIFCISTLICSIILSSCARIIEVSVPDLKNRNLTEDVKLKSIEEVITVKEAEEKINFSAPANVAKISSGLTFGQAGEKFVPSIKFKHIHQSYRFAMASSNAYKHDIYKKHQFKITGWKRIARFENRLGSAADIYSVSRYRKFNDDADLVISFRGTEFKELSDWMYGNFNVLYPGQYKEAELLYNLVRQRYGFNKKIIVTGHSLGGGLALSLARSHPEIDAIVFDASPRMFSAARYPSSQMHIAEKGEILTYVRAIWRNIPPNTFNPLITHGVDYLEGDMLEKHSMYHLALGVLKDSARRGNPDAVRLLKVNPIKQKAIQ